MLPESVLAKAASEMLDYQGTGESVMEMSHRSKEYQAIIDGCEALLREVMGIPDNYKVLFLQGGASSQFAMVPMNLMTGSGKADFVITGQWATKAYKEASRYGDCKAVASSKDKTFSYIPKLDPAEFRPDADYFHICLNNTIYGTVWHELPDTGSVPLVADVSSCILSEPIDVSRFGLLYAGAQKNMGPAGLTVVIVREDLVGKAMESTPTMFNYQTHVDNGSMFNTPPTYAIYICKLVLEWLKNEVGGPCRDEEDQREEGGSPLRFPRPVEALQGHRRQRGPLPHEHPLCHRQRRARREVRVRGEGRRVPQPQGPPFGGRHARLDLQRDAGRGRGKTGCADGEV